MTTPNPSVTLTHPAVTPSCRTHVTHTPTNNHPLLPLQDEINKLVDALLVDLGLVDCADTMIGGPLIKGISGGQRKRTSVGIELITDPALLFLDEPTSGLDSFSGEIVVLAMSLL